MKKDRFLLLCRAAVADDVNHTSEEIHAMDDVVIDNHVWLFGERSAICHVKGVDKMRWVVKLLKKDNLVVERWKRDSMALYQK